MLDNWPERMPGHDRDRRDVPGRGPGPCRYPPAILPGTGSLYPRLRDIRRVSLAIATQVAEAAYDEGVATRSRPESISDDLAAQMYMPNY